MNRLTLADLRLGLKDMLEKRENRVQSCLSGKMYEPLLKTHLLAIDALPPRLMAEPVLESPRGINTDDVAAAFFMQCEWYEQKPEIDPMILVAARQVRDSLVPDLPTVQAMYSAQVASAGVMQRNIEELVACLKVNTRSPPLVDKGWNDFLEQSLVSVDLVSDGSVSSPSPVEDKIDYAASLRNASIGLLKDFRRGLAQEMAADASFPRELDLLIFGYFDELIRLREVRG